LRTIVAKTLAVVRVVYISFAALLGVAFAIASVGSLWAGIDNAIEFARCNSTVEPNPAVIVNCYGIDGPDPLSFDSYG
jgi:hypothetical protein